MHPILIDFYAHERHADMLRTAEMWRAARERRDQMLQERRADREHAASVRERVGWMLVVVGLRLAVGDASRVRPRAWV